MKTAVALSSLCFLVAPLFAQDAVGKQVPAVLPAADPDLKTELRMDPPKGPGLTYQPAAPQPCRRAEQPLPQALAAAARNLRPPQDQVGLREYRPGEWWAHGATYKACFQASGVRFVPFFGSDAPCDYPIDFMLRRVTVGGHDLTLTPKAALETTPRQIDMDWGAVVERYDLRPQEVEQSFTLGRLPEPGDLTVELGVKTMLTTARDGEGLRFANEHGSVSYGAATVVDALGNRAAVAERLVDGVLTLTVPATFLAHAALPVTIDPLVHVNNGVMFGAFHPDVAYDRSEDRFLLVYAVAFSRADLDVYGVLFEADGTPVANSARGIETTTANWDFPRVANLGIPHRFLVVAAAVTSAGSGIYGCTVDASLSGQVGAPFLVSANGGNGDKFNADVGGDPNPIGPTWWLVVWERAYSTTDHDIHGQLVDQNGQLHGPALMIDNSANSVDTHPAIGKCDGNPPGASQEWVVVWQHTYSATDEDIWHARVRWDGVFNHSSSGLQTATLNDTMPAVSSVTDEHGGRRQWLAVYTRDSVVRQSATELFLTFADAGGVRQNVALHALEGSPQPDAQYGAHVDSDGYRFAVSYCDGASMTGGNLYLSTFHPVYGASLAASEVRTYLDQGFVTRICAARSGGQVDTTRYLAAWNYADGWGTLDYVNVAAYDGYAPGTSLTLLPTGCDGLDLGHSGAPLLGRTVAFQLQNTGANVPLMMFGLPFGPVTACAPCGLGVDLLTTTFVGGPLLTLQVPYEGALVHASLSVQGMTLGTGPCLGQVRMSPTARLTIR